MRISDWSSDVCSSDLLAPAIFSSLSVFRPALACGPGGIHRVKGIAQRDFADIPGIGIVKYLRIDEEDHRHPRRLVPRQRLLGEAEALDPGEIFARLRRGDRTGGVSGKRVSVRGN